MPSIDARITRVEQDENGWFRIHTDDERVKRLDTKLEPKAKEAQALMRERVLARIEFSERETDKVNPNTGRPYPPNRYYESAGQLGDTPDDQIPVVQTTRATTAPGEAWRICLAAGGKLAVATLPMMPVQQRSFEVQKQIATAWAEFFFFSEPPAQPTIIGGNNSASSFPAPAATGAGRNPGAYDAPLGDAPPPPSDDDIPY